MKKVFLEYIWLDGYTSQNLRSKLKIIDPEDIEWGKADIPKIDSLPRWNFDGSSTRQAPGNNSECLLNPVRIYEWDRPGYYFVLCEVLDSNKLPHVSNTRSLLREILAEEDTFWWGFEQEYFLKREDRPAGFPKGGYPNPQGKYYCGVGSQQVSDRYFVEDHLEQCLGAGISLTGINAEVALGQWEYQCFAKDTLKACDDLWMSRYILHRVSEQYEVSIDFDPKPIAGDWNGSGCHTNFSNKKMRETGGQTYFSKIIWNLDKTHDTHMEHYGENNEKRLTGDHETQHINRFSYGVGDRGASIRVPNQVVRDGWKGYLEDRRPASNCDPYQVTYLITTAINNNEYATTAEGING